MRREPDCLMFRIPAKGDKSKPVFITPPSDRINYWRWRGWILLIDEHEVRRADLDDTRESDERRR